MTYLLQQVFTKASKLPELEQNALARLVLAELESERRWEKAFSESEQALERLAAEVEHSLRYFTYELGYAKERQLDALYLCGGGARLKNLSPFLASRVNTRVEVADPFGRWPMSEAVSQRLKTDGLTSTLITSLGLALHPTDK